jgi:hypothetical protein
MPAVIPITMASIEKRSARSPFTRVRSRDQMDSSMIAQPA